MAKAVTRVALCGVKGCPAPNDADFHVCPHCGAIEASHHHLVFISQGGNDGPQLFICNELHDAIHARKLYTFWNAPIWSVSDGTQLVVRYDVEARQSLLGGAQGEPEPVDTLATPTAHAATRNGLQSLIAAMDGLTEGELADGLGRGPGRR